MKKDECKHYRMLMMYDKYQNTFRYGKITYKMYFVIVF